MREPTIDDWLKVVLRDFAGTPVAHLAVALVHLDPDPAAAASSWAHPHDRRLLLTVGDNVTSLDGFTDDPAAAAAEIASSLQDTVMDELNRPWPEVAGGTVLEPRVGPGHRPEWAGRGVVCAVGELRDRFGV